MENVILTDADVTFTFAKDAFLHSVMYRYLVLFKATNVLKNVFLYDNVRKKS